MTVDHIPLPFTAIRPLPPPWPPAGNDRDRFAAEPPEANSWHDDEPPNGTGGWPRIFPGL